MQPATAVALVLGVLAVGLVAWLVIARPGDPLRAAQAEAFRRQAEAEAARRTPKGERVLRGIEAVFGAAGGITQQVLAARGEA